MNTLYVRIQPKRNVGRFFRCGFAFSQAWLKLENVDSATAKRLRAEQMLEVTDSKPADWEEPATLSGDDKATPDSKTAGVSTEEMAKRMQDIRDAVAKLDPADQALWTGSGKPKTEAISGILGWNVSATERDSALELGGKS
nr:hypothetical protein [uncultured Comamonas sp.]